MEVKRNQRMKQSQNLFQYKFYYLSCFTNQGILIVYLPY